MKNTPAPVTPRGLVGSLRAQLIRLTSIIEVEQHYVVAAPLTRESVIIDLGANRGRFTRAFRARFGCRVVAVEPEADNFASLPAEDGVVPVRAAISGRCGRTTIQLSNDSTAHSILGESPPAATGAAQEVIMLDFNGLLAATSLPRIDVLKVDIEGCEWDFFDSMSDAQLTAIGQITVEFHDFIPACRAYARTWPFYQRLMRLGFRCIEDPIFRSYNVLFVNKRLAASGLIDSLLLPLLHLLLKLNWKIQRLKKFLPRPGPHTGA